MADEPNLTVGALIAALSALPLDAPVAVTNHSMTDWWGGPGNRPAPRADDVDRPSWWITNGGAFHVMATSRTKAGLVLVHPDARDGDIPIVVFKTR